MATTNTIDTDQLQKQLAKAEQAIGTLKKQLAKVEKANDSCTNDNSKLLTKFKDASNLHGAQKDAIARWTANYTRSDEEKKKLLKENETLKKSWESFKEVLHDAQADMFAKYHELLPDHSTTKDLHHSFEDGNGKIKNLVQNFKNDLYTLYDEIAQENELTQSVSEVPPSI